MKIFSNTMNAFHSLNFSLVPQYIYFWRDTKVILYYFAWKAIGQGRSKNIKVKGRRSELKKILERKDIGTTGRTL